uniref:BED-type domain-containing protein n=1 Tax=Cucumis melo TaxID=3656 RepID=A0A9I9DRG0_CUCME
PSSCEFCSKVTKGRVYRLKHHLVGGYRNDTACRKCPDHMKEEIKDYMSKKKEIKEQRNLIVDIDVQDYGIEDEDEGSVSVNNRATSSGLSLKKPRQKGPMDAFFSHSRNCCSK